MDIVTLTKSSGFRFTTRVSGKFKLLLPKGLSEFCSP